MTTAYPLAWPDGWPRTKWRKEAQFRMKATAFARVRDGILHELHLLGGRSAVLSTDVELRLDGIPYANRREPDDPGVAVYWYDPKTKTQRAMACDRWRKIVHNMRAIELSLQALRGLERWGSSEIVKRAFTGFAALPAPAHDWRAVLGVPAGERSIVAVRNRYHDLARDAHPDVGGSEREMQRLNGAMAAAERELLE